MRIHKGKHLTHSHTNDIASCLSQNASQQGRKRRRSSESWKKGKPGGKLVCDSLPLCQIVNAQHSRLAFSFWPLPCLIVPGIIIVSSSSLLFSYSPAFPAPFLFISFALLYSVFLFYILRLPGKCNASAGVWRSRRQSFFMTSALYRG